MKKALKLKHGGSFKRSRSPAPGKPYSTDVPWAAAELNEYDKLYLLLAKENHQNLFNILCYDLGAAGLADLYNIDKSVIKNKYGVVMSGKIKTALDCLPKDEKKADFDHLVKFNGRKHGYKEELRAKGIPLIDKEDLKIRNKITSGPFAGTVCLAQWTKPDNRKVLVCLRYDQNSSQRNRFICEAEVSRELQHENILNVHGVVILGDYAESVALVVDCAPFGNIRESVSKQSVHGICSYIRQIADALSYIDSKGFIHTRISAAFVYLMEPEKVKIGGLWGCVRRSELSIGSAKGKLRVRRSNVRMGLADKSMSAEDVVSWFGYCMSSCFEYLEYYRSQRKTWLLPLQKQINEDFGVLCPDIYKSLFKRCCTQQTKETRPSLSEILQFVSQKDVPMRLQATKDFVGDSKENLGCNKADVLTLISKTKDKKGRWFGEKLGGEVGFFDGSHTKKIDTEDETIIASAEAAVAHLEPEAAAEERLPELVIPAEILARGAQAELAYWRALRNGKVRVYRGRIMLVGQDRAGKTSLKKSLLGMPFDPKQQSTEGVEVDPSVFEVDVDKVTNWQRVEDKKLTSQFADELARMVVGELKNAPTEATENREAEEGTQSLEVEEDVVDSNEEKQPEIVELKPDLLSDVQVADLETKQTDPATSDVSKDETSSKGNQVQIKIDVTSGSVPEDITKLVVQYLQELKLEEAVDSKEAVVSVWDFAGQHLYYASHPVFLSTRAIYVLVYNLSKDLNAKAEPCVRQGVYDIILENTTDETNLENILSWLVSIHSVAKCDDEEVQREEEKLPYMRPPVVVVGTHSDQSHQEPKRAEACIKKSISRKTFEQHVVRPFFVVNNTLSSADPGVQKLRQKINELFQLEPYMGEDVPIRWFSFEKVAEALVEKKTTYLELDQLERIVREVCLIEDETEVASMLNFYHDLGVIIKYGSTVVLQAQWLIDLFKKLITIRPYDEQDPRFSDHWEELEEQGILRPQLVDHVFSGFISKGQSREDILNMMEMYGLIARFGGNSQAQTPAPSSSEMKDAKYFVPAQLRSSPKSLADMEPTENDPCPLYVHFLDGFLPHGLFPQVVSRFIKWCSQEGCRHEPNLYLNVARFILGRNGVHDLILIRHKRFIKIVVKTVKPAVEEKQAGNSGLAPRPSNPAIEARRFLEATLEELSTETPWLRNIRYELAVLCPSCASSESQCSKHRQNGCDNDDCLHLLGIRYGEPLICTKTYGDSSRVDTMRVEDWFVETPCEEENSEVEIEVRTEAVVDFPSDSKGNDYTVPGRALYKSGPVTREVMMLLARDIGPLWKRLGQALGLEEPELDQIEADEGNLYERSYGMLRKWTQIRGSSGTFEELGRALMNKIVRRDDLVDRYCLKAERESAKKDPENSVIARAESLKVDAPAVVPRPPVFISYQWDIQETVKELKDRLEKAGFQCWMDINQMGGGDALNAEIDAGIRASKVVIACVTERYCKSENCQRETTLADLLRRPIIPLLLQPMDWPPPGQLAMVLAKLLYIDMTLGPEAIPQDKFNELTKKLEQQISN